MKIGNLNIKNKIFLAPMAGITDSVFRGLCAEQGASMTFTEMISAKGLFYENRNTQELLSLKYDRVPCGVQLFGSDPDIMAEQAKNPVLNGFAAIDINMGCPARKIVSNGEGSALLERPSLAYEVIHAAAKNAAVPVTVKIRSGADGDHINAVEIARLAERAGAAAITVHGRTREQGYSGKADLQIIQEVKEAIGIPVIGNGDVQNGETALCMLNKTGCDGVMIGRAAFGNPWIFCEISDTLLGKVYKAPSAKERGELILRHAEQLCALKGEENAVKQMRKHLCAYTHGLSGASKLRAQMQAVSVMADVAEIVERIFFCHDI